MDGRPPLFSPDALGRNALNYQRTLLERFSNTYIKDKLSRLAQDGSAKFRSTLLGALPALPVLSRWLCRTVLSGSELFDKNCFLTR